MKNLIDMALAFEIRIRTIQRTHHAPKTYRPPIMGDLDTMWGIMTYIRVYHDKDTTLTENADGTITLTVNSTHYKERLTAAAQKAGSVAVIDDGGGKAHISDFGAFLDEIDNSVTAWKF